MKTRIQKALAILIALTMVLSMGVVAFAEQENPFFTPSAECDDGYRLTIHHFVVHPDADEPGTPDGTQPTLVGEAVEGATWRFYRVSSDETFLLGANPAAAAYAARGAAAPVAFVAGSEVTTGDNGLAQFTSTTPGIFLAVNSAIDTDLNPNQISLHPPFLVTLPFLWNEGCECPAPVECDYDCDCPGECDYNCDCNPPCECDVEYSWLCHVNAFTKTPDEDLEFGKDIEDWEFVCDCPAPEVDCSYDCSCPDSSDCQYDCDCEPEEVECDCDLEVMTLVVDWYFSFRIWESMANLRPVDCECDDACNCDDDEDVMIRVTDILDERLSFVGDSVVITIVDEDGDVIATLIEDVHFTIEFTAGPPEVIEFEITRAGVEFILENSDEGDTVRIDFRTEVSLDEDDDLGDIFNDGELDFGRDVNIEIDEDDRPYVTVFGIQILKVDATDATNTLEGAEFHLYRPEDIVNGRPVDGAIPVAIFEATGADGITSVYGIPAGDWYLYETESPAGFRRITNAILVTVGEATEGDTDYLVEIVFPNERGFDLPLTGGAGTILFTIGGLVLIGGAVALLIFSPKKKNRA